MNKILRNVIYLAVLVGGTSMVIVGQKHIGPAGLGLMLVGLVALLALLYAYNRRFQ